MTPSTSYALAWDAEYRAKGRLWKGVAVDVPMIPKGTRTLEMGCGDGKTLIELARQDIELHGIDISDAAIELSNKAMQKSGRKATIIKGDVTHLPYDDRFFGVVFAHHILDHLFEEDRRKAAAEVTRVLAPAGKFHFRGFSIRDLRAETGERTAEQGTVVKGNGIIYHYFERNEVGALFPDLNMVTIREMMRRMGGKQSLERAFIVAELAKP